jgi:hypothetical protein
MKYKPDTKPQQIRRRAGPGTLLKRLFGLHEQSRRRAFMGDDPIYLSRVRQLPCLYCGVDGFTEACHVRMQSGAFNKHGGMGKKPEDKWALPICSEHHRRQHAHPYGEAGFWIEVGINPLLVASRLYDARGDLVRMRAIAVQAIAERES